MNRISRVPFFVGMVLLTLVSMWTTYVSVNESILPDPKVSIPIGADKVWDCSVFALGLSVAIGLMLFSLKLAIIDEHKRLSPLGVIGLSILAFISISFNMDVLYRKADEDFFMDYSRTRMTSVYHEYLASTQHQLRERKLELQKEVAGQEAELEAEIRGLRDDPAGYGPVARQEDYALTKIQKINEVELTALEEAYESKRKADQLLGSADPQTLEEIQQLQNQLRVLVKDLGAVTGVPLPAAVKLESPLFAVFSKLFDFRTVGLTEIFFLILAFFLDLGDIIGYSLVPNRRKRPAQVGHEDSPPALRAVPEFEGPELIAEPEMDVDQERAKELFFSSPAGAESDYGDQAEVQAAEGQRRRPFRFRRR
ncbi:MAG: hypothetical protein JXR94_01945 [Candidatus Hydrogenedentes bacterium]|nr:hypothetical protein [Candidatus Hydrogenedentota bacterium]